MHVALKFIAAVVVAAVVGIAGCKSVDWKGDNFHDDLAQWGEKQRPPDQPQTAVAKCWASAQNRSRSNATSACAELFRSCDVAGKPGRCNPRTSSREAAPQQLVVWRQRGAFLRRPFQSRVQVANRLRRLGFRRAGALSSRRHWHSGTGFALVRRVCRTRCEFDDGACPW